MSISTMQYHNTTPYSLTSNVISVPVLGNHSKTINYPLYDRLVAEVQSNPVVVNVTNMAYTINLISDSQGDYAQLLQHYREILMLCIHHAMVHQHYQPNPNQLPYAIRTMSSGRGVLVVVGDLPGFLVQIIDAYVNGKY